MLHLSNTFVLSAGTVSIDLSKNLILLLYSPRNHTYFLPKGRKDLHESLPDAAVRETLEESGYSVTLLAHSLPTNATHAHSHPEASSHLLPRTTAQAAEAGPPLPPRGARDEQPGPPRGALGCSAPTSRPAPAGLLPDRGDCPSVCGDNRVSAPLEDCHIRHQQQQEQQQQQERHVEPIAIQQRAYRDSYKVIFWYLAEVDSGQVPVEGQREEWEDYEVCWVGGEEAVGKVTREEDGRIIAWAVEGARGILAFVYVI
ncbi:hypothetical protein PRK78_000943 [Emydomyces testavorans]|uniref:Nudix hydrolase domain-containing protein n=1 Tax=Emydomyces testavorans TaxID=2070801 RepID=A0AAF0IG59_9EURO|nr:hypothetical protein PRK78_000943 [Emydomyces testavorans]